ncbi:Gfo/Idh/MocA family oxidoreductase [Thalassoglobus sp. JC818]|uniref:Gfo/Idh/MocA family protein n=1 Tax=Thalassoglobus sp. JC818 TaxID=3232136 RepID=UPI003457C2E9
MAGQLRVGVFGRTGRGNYGHGLDTVWLDMPETEIVAVCDEDAEGRAKAGKKLRTTQLYSDYRKMLAEAQLDIIAICPRWIDQHRDVAIAAAEHGVHIFMEKPFCRSPQEADEIVQACEMRHIKLAIAHPTTYSPRIPVIKSLIEDDTLGQIVEVRLQGKEDRRGGPEDLWVLGSHMLDLLLTLGFEPQSCFATILQSGSRAPLSEVYDGNEGLGPLLGNSLRAEYALKSGIASHFRSVQNCAGNPSRYGMRICGSKGVMDIYEGTLAPTFVLLDSNWSTGQTDSRWQQVSSAGIGAPEPLTGKRYQSRNQIAAEDLIDAIQKDRNPLCNMYQARQVVELICATFESHRTGSLVELPLQTRTHPFANLL